MKNVFFTFLLVTFSSPLWSQTEKGTHFLGTTASLFGQGGATAGGAGFAFGTNTSKSAVDGLSTTEKEKVTAFNFSPTYGYFLANGLVAGASVGFASNKTKDDDDDKFTYSTFSAGPFLRYYFNTGKKVQPFAEARGGFLSVMVEVDYDGGNDDFDDSNKGGYAGGRAGAAIFLGPKTSLDIFADYSILTLKGEDVIFDTTVKSTDTSSSFGLGIGFTLLL